MTGNWMSCVQLKAKGLLGNKCKIPVPLHSVGKLTE